MIVKVVHSLRLVGVVSAIVLYVRVSDTRRRARVKPHEQYCIGTFVLTGSFLFRYGKGTIAHVVVFTVITTARGVSRDGIIVINSHYQCELIIVNYCNNYNTSSQYNNNNNNISLQYSMINTLL